MHEETEPEVEKMPVVAKPPTVVKKSPAKSNIQRKISAKKKGERRSMTQPITGDDVSAAKDLVKEQRSQQASGTSEQRDKEENNEEERVLTFAERLSYFNKVCARAPPSPEKKPKRGSLKRYSTQPVDLELVLEARRKLEGNEATKDSATPPSVKVEVPHDRVRTISEDFESKLEDSAPVVRQTERPQRLSVASADPGDSSDRSGDESDGHKIGKLKSKYLEQLPSPEPTGRRSPVRGKLTSTGSRSPTSIRGRSPSPINLRPVSPQSSSSEDQQPAEDMGKIREHEIKSTGSIRDRMKLLQKNQEEDWKKKVRKEDQKAGIKSSLGDRVNKLQENEEKWKKSKPEPVVNGGRASAVGNANISDRLNSIMTNSEGWKSKVGKQNDASQFTVKAKIKRSNVVPILPSPSMKRRVLPVPINDEPVITIDDVSSDAPSLGKLSDVLKLARKSLEPEVLKTVEQSTTEIPDFVNEDFESFFSASTITIEHEVRVKQNGVRSGSVDSDTEEPEESLPDWLIEEEHHMEYLSQLGHLKRSVQRGSRNRSSTRNPVKALAARADIKQSYTEQRSNVLKLEQQRLASRHGHGSNFTSAALAGLATRADFSKVSLRSTKKTSAFSASDYKPWQSKMLLRVKGRRSVQTRLVEPCAASLNSGDAFLLILPDKMYGWFGEFCNVIERAKVQEIADYIIHQGDMGSKATSINVIEENASSKIAAREFWQLIGGKGEYDPSGGDEEDETYELNAEASIKTYKMVDAKLVPVPEAWGKLPTMGMLETTETYVFDFGAEMYTWQGKEVSFDNRQLALRLARALWDQGYDFSDVNFCPFSPVSQMSTNLKGTRPEWGLFARVNENLETALMQEKFEDWSNIHREIGDREKELKETSRGHVAHEMSTKSNIRPEMTKCDVQKMIDGKTNPLPVKLEGMNLWRGYGELLDEDGRGLQVVTASVFCWKATDKSMEEVPETNWGIFHRGDTYVVRWCYVVSSTGKWSANEEGERNEGKKEAIGRERTAYFLWTGRDSTINEKGASALMATEIDKTVGSQVIVTEGKEPPAMTQCFKGAMVTVDGKQGERGGYYSWKLFSVRGNSTDEASLHQVPCECQTLRTRTSFVALNARQAKLVVWHGCASPENTRNLAEAAAAKIQENKLASLGFRARCKEVEVNVCEEGKENEDFIEAMLRIRRNKYCSLLETEGSKVKYPRAWNLLPSGDEFVAEELPPVTKPLSDGLEPYPLVPEQLQDLTRPALVLFDTFDGLYLWHSSIPDEVMKGPGKRQLDINKRLAMETSIEYCNVNRPEHEPILIHEFHEPLPFINSFPYWTAKNDKISTEQKRIHKPIPVKDVLKTVTRLTYTIEELQDTDNLPEGVEPNHLETYLSVKDFNDLFEMTKEEFYKLPPWKQQNLRKEKKLY
uniref:Supervillin-like n=1 Tax=Phallusia mammillata TaxID=59560 RepID=A0A6F9DUR2_9ASCI|nr:supervillin-like [Phallusia mammillata]